MKKKFYILMCLASLVLMVTACGGKEKIKENPQTPLLWEIRRGKASPPKPLKNLLIWKI